VEVDVERERGSRKPAARDAQPVRRRAANARDPRTIEKVSPKKSTRTARMIDAAAGRVPPKQRAGSASQRLKGSPQGRATAERGSVKPVTKRALKGGGPKTATGSTRGGKR
jgi:hypothetical protein